MNKLILMCGIPGAGKSTWLHQNKKTDEYVISRDEIRFALLEDEDDYFSKEEEVWGIYVVSIEYLLRLGETVYADATHLNHGARLKLLKALDIIPDEIEVIYFKVPLEVAQERNAQRAGRAYVPPEAIAKMYRALEEPKRHEGIFTYNKIYIIDENGNMEEKV